MTTHSLFVTASRGLVGLLEQELLALGAKVVRPAPAGLRVRGPLSFAYRICLWSRTASRVILHLHDAAIDKVDDLQHIAFDLPWEDHLAPDGTLVVDMVAQGEVVTHSRYAAQLVKDGICDRLRNRFGTRPSVDPENPDVRISVYVRGRGCSIGIDLAGAPLHRRGWRPEQGPAPLKETLAAALLLHGDWPARAAAGELLLDPLCGVGTIAIEGASIAGDRAPALLRPQFGFTKWRGHDEAAWTELRREASERARAGASNPAKIIGYDADPEAIVRARANAERAGVAPRITFERASLRELMLPRTPGLLCTNPPYGARMGDEAEVRGVYSELAQLMARGPEWGVRIIAAESAPIELLGLSLADAPAVDNGPLACRIVGANRQPIAAAPAPADDNPFAARIRKNLRRLEPWAQRFGVEAYRLYDQEIPGFHAIVDRYGDRVHLQEYQAPRKIDPSLASERVRIMVDALVQELGVAREHVHVKRRRPQTGGNQYGHFDRRGEEMPVREGDYRFLVNLTDYLDTGLFIDHRALRRMVAALAPGKRVLNLFGYTGAISVVAAKAGAHTTTVDLSNTYLDWAERNFAVNGLDAKQHAFVKADCMAWLPQARERWDIVVCDPPSWSSSKAMTRTLEIQRDHVELVRACMNRLAPHGTLFFSTNKRGFALDGKALPELVDITAKSLDPDVRREPPPHRCWRFGGV
ncbi:MAG TPA: bifunctional 23S rRNA (guanine(2069)-N(7))-methyltransferase RlmK/23S rRNA (guanine(2445)-N(2))-methyltransferase RlmL [Nannocystaceae bacterium]|nr:bifunctional 23S rRNA (guanine(2069)-N(7))-methyltransferase RlmK/23S rRNA (guanine(2445)-N(2))-methyltransferase RlmL [Nannocystaceae bacterium]